VCLYVIIILLHDLTLLRCKTCAIDIGSLKATYLLTYLLTKGAPLCFSFWLRVLDKAVYSAFKSALNSSIVPYRIVS